MNYKVVIDAGHGGVDSGAVSGNNLEKDLNLKAAKYIYERLKQLGIPTVITRDDDTTLPKKERIEKINQISDKDPSVILISNHINAGGGEGVEIVYPLRNNSTLADMILNNIGEQGQKVRNTYQRRLPENPNLDYYYILRDTSPREAVLIEYGFIDNKNDLKRLQENLDLYAEGVVKAIADYTNNTYIPPSQNSNNEYIVQKGDTLYSIAARYGLSVDELKRLNNLSSNIISIGQRLIISSNNDAEASQIYIVNKGDSLWSISRKYGLTVDQLIKANNLSNLTIYEGQELLIPNSIVDNKYIVQRGDTLYSIARKFNTTVDEIVNKNNLNSSLLSIGQELLI